MCRTCELFPQVTHAIDLAHSRLFEASGGLNGDFMESVEQGMQADTDAEALRAELFPAPLPNPATVAGRMAQYANLPVAALPEGELWWLENQGTVALAVQAPDGLEIPYALIL